MRDERKQTDSLYNSPLAFIAKIVLLSLTYRAPRLRMMPTDTLALRLSWTFQRSGIGLHNQQQTQGTVRFDLIRTYSMAENQSVAMFTAVVA
jgi:hypothetical protein